MYLGAGLFFLVGSFLVMAEARNLEYYTRLGPGPGFFPFWISAVLAVLSGIWLVQTLREPTTPLDKDFVPDRDGVLRILAVVGSVTAMGFLMDIIGFQLSAFAFLVFLLFALGRQNIVVTLVIAAAGSFGLYAVFTHYLDVSLPMSTIPFLLSLGL
jgi:hypothetical protein